MLLDGKWGKNKVLQFQHPILGSDNATKRCIQWGTHPIIANISHTIKMTWLAWIKG